MFPPAALHVGLASSAIAHGCHNRDKAKESRRDNYVQFCGHKTAKTLLLHIHTVPHVQCMSAIVYTRMQLVSHC